MQDLTRRSFVISAAAAGAAFGLDGPLEIFSSAAHAQGSNPIGAPQALVDQGFAKFKVGSIEVIQVYDGHWEKAHDPGFIRNASLDDVKAATTKAGLTDAFVPISFTVTLARIGGRTIMFDSSTGGQLAPTAGRLVAKNLAAAGVQTGDISTIIVTHYHADHIWGLMAKETNAQLYPNAEIIVPEPEHKHWTAPELVEKVPEGARGNIRRIQATLPTWKNLRPAAVGTEVTSGVRSIATHGHTPGHTSYVVSAGSDTLIVSGDVTNIPPLNLSNPGWHVIFDANPALAEEGRRKLMDQAIADKSVVTGYHWGLPGAGTIRKDGSGYVLVPVSV
jgi:glyoxylase-like metal-dependent hydrolase (beta-lactamase superfamily II)